jgi:hypothetical protein
MRFAAAYESVSIEIRLKDGTQNPTSAVHACTQYAISIPFRWEASVSSTKKPGVDVPAQRNMASGQRPSWAAHTSSNAAAAASASLIEYEYDFNFWPGLWRTFCGI